MPPDAIPLCFGPNSFERHVTAARARGIEPVIVESALLGLDIDQPEDLQQLWTRLANDPDLVSEELLVTPPELVE
jgi:2-phospho-L-lactate guanylyltransferase (CobY/MobA/RfbA family)